MKTSSFTSTGLSDLATLVFWFHSPALRFGLCWYRIGLSDLVCGMNQPAPKERFDTSIARQSYEPRIGLSALDCSIDQPAPKERSDTSIARQGYDHARPHTPRSERPLDLPRRSNTQPLSDGLSDLTIVTFWFHSPALRFGLCWYRSGLSDLASVVPLVRQLKLCWYRPGLSDLDCRMDQLAPKERFDTSIARQGYGQNHPEFLGLKDRWIIPPLAASARFAPNLI